MRFITVYILVALLGCSFVALAQKKKQVKKPVKKQAAKPFKREPSKSPIKDSNTLKGATIEILQSYKPEVKQAVKPDAVPALPPTDTSIPVMKYEVPAQGLSFTYNSLPLRPLTLVRDSNEKKFKNYVKLGGGNLSTILFDAGITALKGKKFETTIHLHHLSQADNNTSQKTSLSGIEVSGTVHSAKHDWLPSVEYSQSRFNYYGFSTLTAPGISYKNLKAGIGLRSTSQNSKLSYRPEFNFCMYSTTGDSNNLDANEKRVSMNAPFVYRSTEALSLAIGVNASYYATTTTGLLVKNDVVQNNYVLQFSPSIDYRQKTLYLHAGVIPTIGTNKFYLLPDIKLKYAVEGTQLSVFGGWQGRLLENNFQNVSTTNPYIVPYLYNIQQTGINEVYAGAQSNVGNHFTITGKAELKQYDAMPLYYNDTATLSDMNHFRVAYDKVSTLSLRGAVGYHIGNSFGVDLNVTYTGYTPENYKQAWHEPGVVIGADIMARPMPQLVVNGYMLMMDDIYAVDKGNSVVKLPTIFDIGASAEYSFIKRLSAFVQVKNILNNRYQRWYGYGVYGINIAGGLRVKF
ncbi:MAG: TonB-dependent receptor [Bacteroidetes bacterium]|nr:TonB-dependent receptor [Bacteroidota bacterium]